MRLFWAEQFILFTSLRNSDQLWRQSTAKCANPLVAEEVYPHWDWCWEKLDLGKFNFRNRCALWTLALCQDSLYILNFSYMLLLNIHASILEHFYIVDWLRLLITESLSWKDTIFGHSESSTCVLSEHIGKKGDRLCTQMKLTYTVHIQHPMRGMTGREQDWSLLFPKDDVSLSSMLVIAH